MHADKPSLTAAVVSFARGAVSTDVNGPCFDPVAVELLPPPFTQALVALDRAGPGRRVLEPLLRAAFGGIIGHVELRTAVIDEALRQAHEAGVRQLVILGAGLDSRAWRMEELRDWSVFEVDHPATQAWKKERTGPRPPLARAVHFVAVDFEKTSLTETLGATEHDPSKPTFWIWEGVTPYLNRSAIESSLRIIAAKSAPGSRLAVTYLTPDVISASRLKRLTFPIFKLISEPLHGMITREELKALLEQHQFQVLSDELPADAGKRFGKSTVRGIVSPSERVAIAEQTPSPNGRAG